MIWKCKKYVCNVIIVYVYYGMEIFENVKGIQNVCSKFAIVLSKYIIAYIL